MKNSSSAHPSTEGKRATALEGKTMNKPIRPNAHMTFSPSEKSGSRFVCLHMAQGFRGAGEGEQAMFMEEG